MTGDMRHMPQLYTIPPLVPFVDSLALGIVDRFGDAADPLALSRVTILVPTRRAVRSLADAFLRLAQKTGPAALLLPQMQPIGDVDEDELISESFPGQADAQTLSNLPQSMPALRRQFILAQLIHRWGERSGKTDPHVNLAHPNQVVRLADDLGRFFDTLTTERVDPSKLSDIVPDQFTEHWRHVLSFLTIISEHWPAILNEENAIDTAERRNRLLQAQAQLWRTAPPRDPVIAAGSTGSIPATADLLSVIALLDQGAVVLPGLDLDMDEAGWVDVDPSHPQFGMKELLERMDVDRKAVALWAQEKKTIDAEAAQLRRRVIAEALRPANATDGWQSSIEQFEAQGLARGLDGLSFLSAADPDEEASVIAMMLREVLHDHADATGALVTPDRGLARRVAAKLGRWDIAIDDSAGTPLGQTRVGIFLRLIAEVAKEQAAPVSLLSVLKHPLCRCGLGQKEWRRLVEQLEIACLRGPRPGEGVSGLRRACARLDGDNSGMSNFLGRMEAALAPVLSLSPQKPVALRDLVSAHIEAAENLATTEDKRGTALWSGDDGEAAARLLSEMIDEANHAPLLFCADYAALFDGLMAERVVRPRHGLHPRLFIWGPLEARLQRADVIVLGGLNEGTWPSQVDTDPWLSRQMRAQLGLSPPERRIGLAAHDFAQLTNADRVVLTRSQRVEGTPTVASRWLMRLQTILRGAGAENLLHPVHPYTAWAKQLDEPQDYAPLSPPAPRPPLSARPRQFSVTEIESWIRDPYAIYAKKVLQLLPLEPLDDDPGRPERGIVIHDILEKFVRQFTDELPVNAYDELISIGQDVFDRARFPPALRAFWWRQFLRIAESFVDFERDLRVDGHPLGTEVAGSLELSGSGGPFVLVARADRIDEISGAFAISDYKTGAVPSQKQVDTLLVPQLPLEGLIAREGGFEGIEAATVTYLGYVRLSGSGTPVSEILVADESDAAASLIGEAEAGLLRYIANFDDADTPYLSRPRPMFATRASVYDHLARVKEWSVPGLSDAGDGA